MKHIFLPAILLLFAICADGQEATSPQHLIAENRAEFDFCLASQIFTADILVDEDDSKTVLLATGLLSDDVERITGRKPGVKYHMNAISSDCVIIGSIDGSKIIKELVKKKKIDIAEIKGKWESGNSRFL